MIYYMKSNKIYVINLECDCYGKKESKIETLTNLLPNSEREQPKKGTPPFHEIKSKTQLNPHCN